MPRVKSFLSESGSSLETTLAVGKKEQEFKNIIISDFFFFFGQVSPVSR